MSKNKHTELNPNVSLMRWPEVHQLTGICRSHAHALAAKGLFPSPIKLGKRASAWLESEISEWILARIAESRPALERGDEQ